MWWHWGKKIKKDIPQYAKVKIPDTSPAANITQKK
jgi:hypothetical protein